MGSTAGTSAGSTAVITRGNPAAGRSGPSLPGPSRHQLALMVWTAIVPTVTVLQFALGDLLQMAPVYLRAPIMATCAVPIVVYVGMPRLQRLRARLINR